MVSARVGLAGSYGSGAIRLVAWMQWGNPRRLWGTGV